MQLNLRIGNREDVTRPDSMSVRLLKFESAKVEAVLDGGADRRRNDMSHNIRLLAPFIFSVACIATFSAKAVSFDCAKAISKVENAICANPSLSSLDSRLDAVYQAVQGKTEDKIGVLTAQRAWLTETRNACLDDACLRTVYEQRIAALSSILPAEVQAMIPTAEAEEKIKQNIESVSAEQIGRLQAEIAAATQANLVAKEAARERAKVAAADQAKKEVDAEATRRAEAAAERQRWILVGAGFVLLVILSVTGWLLKRRDGKLAQMREESSRASYSRNVPAKKSTESAAAPVLEATQKGSKSGIDSQVSDSIFGVMAAPVLASVANRSVLTSQSIEPANDTNTAKPHNDRMPNGLLTNDRLRALVYGLVSACGPAWSWVVKHPLQSIFLSLITLGVVAGPDDVVTREQAIRALSSATFEWKDELLLQMNGPVVIQRITFDKTVQKCTYSRKSITSSHDEFEVYDEYDVSLIEEEKYIDTGEKYVRIVCGSHGSSLSMDRSNKLSVKVGTGEYLEATKK